MSSYDDMMALERPLSWHPKMQRQDRAKIFAPFDALTGLGKAVEAKGRVLVTRVHLTEGAQEQLDEKLRTLVHGDIVTVAWFVPVRHTEDEVLGEYATLTDTVVRVDAVHQCLILRSQEILFDDIIDLFSDSLTSMEYAYESL